LRSQVQKSAVQDEIEIKIEIERGVEEKERVANGRERVGESGQATNCDRRERSSRV